MKYNKQISLGYDPDTGKQKRRWIHANTKQELAEKIEQIHRELEETPNTSRITFRQYSQQWFEVYKTNRAARTREMYEYALRKCSDLDRYPLKSITKTQCQQIINALWDTPVTAKIVRDTMKQIFKAAVNDGIILRNPADGLVIPEAQRAEKHLLTERELEAVRNAELDPQDRMFVTILQVFGLRPAEALALTPADFDLKKKQLTISKAVELSSDNTSRIKDTKTGIVRTIPIPDALVPSLKAYFKDMDSFYMFPKQDGNLMTKSGYRRMSERVWRAVNEAFGGDDNLNYVTGRNFYDFRHYRATEWYYLCQEGQISPKYAASLLGHSEEIFLKIYSHISPEKERIQDLYPDLSSVINL